MAKSYRREKGTKTRSTIRPVSPETNLKVPTLMNRLGLTNEVLIEKYLVPLLSANTTICIREQGKARRVRILDYGTRQRALDMAFKLSGAYAPTNPRLAENFDIIDMPLRREGIHVIDIPPPRKKDT